MCVLKDCVTIAKMNSCHVQLQTLVVKYSVGAFHALVSINFRGNLLHNLHEVAMIVLIKPTSIGYRVTDTSQCEMSCVMVVVVSLLPLPIVASPNDIHNSEKLRNRFWSGSAILIVASLYVSCKNPHPQSKFRPIALQCTSN